VGEPCTSRENFSGYEKYWDNIVHGELEQANPLKMALEDNGFQAVRILVPNQVFFFEWRVARVGDNHPDT
jgi:hypothetical protein